ncbi:thioredoxin domain-containing protein [Candidatus Uhrbacteria bacterium]|jgi:protein-disulfide isomerase|nr:thioredoxin domain-containing protein [Candidatus Uhrbacteria bacterium]
MRLIEITPPVNGTEPATPTSPKKGGKKNTGLMILLGILTLLALAFLWRTVFYYVAIVRGDVEAPTSFATSLTKDASLTAPLLVGDVDSDAIATLDDPSIGVSPDKALLTIVEFADFGCPFSREASYIVRALAEHTDIISYVYRDFPILDLHPNAGWAAEAGECAQDQDRFFDYHDKMYQNQFDLSPTKLKQYAREIGLNGSQFDTCLDTRKHKTEVEEDRFAGIEAGVSGTPTFFFNGKRIEGSIPQDIFNTLLDRYKQLGELEDTGV